MTAASAARLEVRSASAGKNLVYAGKVDHGFDKTTAMELPKKLTPLIRRTQPYSKKIAYRGIWVEPELLAEIEYRAKSGLRARCGIRSSKVCGKTCHNGVRALRRLPLDLRGPSRPAMGSGARVRLRCAGRSLS